MRVKICGITQPDQGQAIAQLGATALGFICVPASPRYVKPDQIRAIVDHLPEDQLSALQQDLKPALKPGLKPGPKVDRIGVFTDADLDGIGETVAIAHLSAVQLHGTESPQFCQQLRQRLPNVEIIKALRIRDAAALDQAALYSEIVDTLLLDAYHPSLLGGTGKTLDWSSLQQFRPRCSWLLAGGLTPENVLEALHQVQPDGIDLSSGVERSPGDKDLGKVARLFQQLQLASPL